MELRAQSPLLQRTAQFSIKKNCTPKKKIPIKEPPRQKKHTGTHDSTRMEARKGVKLKLGSICASPEALELFKHIVEKAHEVRTAAYLLAKHYVLVKLHNNEPLPVDLELLFRDTISSLAAKRPRSNETSVRRQELRGLLRRDFPCLDEGGSFCVDTEGLTGNWTIYEAKKYATHVENHIKAHFHKCLFAFVEAELKLNRKDPLELATIRQTVAAVAQGEELETLGLGAFPAPYALPTLPRLEIDHDDPVWSTSAEEDLPTVVRQAHVEESPMAYLAPLLHMYSRLEHHGCTKRVLSVLPLVKSNVPGHTLIDTQILLDFMPKALLRGKTKDSFRSAWSTPGVHGKQARGEEGNRRLIDGQAELWRLVFDLERCRPRGDGWAFDNTIQTDGHACNLLLRTRADQLAGKRRTFKAPSNDLSTLRALPNLRVIGVDPGKNDLIHCVDDATPVYDATHRKLIDKGHTFRYTRAQRDFEMGKTRRRHEAERYKRRHCPEAPEWEERLRGHPSWTTDVSRFIRFIELFLASREALRPFYLRLVHRRERFESYRLQQKSESRLIAAFKQRMCCKSKAARQRTLIAFGNGSRCNLRNSASGPSSRLRQLFLRHRFKVLDVHEAYTSKRCFHCKHAACENGPHRYHLPGAPDQRPAQVWGVRRCRGCDRPWSRDYHACLNIALLAREKLAGRPRPPYLCRA